MGQPKETETQEVIASGETAEDAARAVLKETRAALREQLEFFIDLQVPGHGPKQSKILLDAIDNLIMLRVNRSMTECPTDSTPFDSIDHEDAEFKEAVKSIVVEAMPTLDDFEKIIKTLLDKRAEHDGNKTPTIEDIEKIADARAKKMIAAELGDNNDDAQADNKKAKK